MGTSWQGTVHNNIDLLANEFIDTIKSTSMSKSYKIPLLLAFYNNGNMRFKINEDDIYTSFKDFYDESKNGVDLQGQKSTEGYENWGKKEYVRLAKGGPIKYLLKGTEEYFYEENDLFCLSEKLEMCMKESEFIQLFKDAIQSLEDRYYKREISTIKESDQKYMDFKSLIISFEENDNQINRNEESLRQEFINKFPIGELEKLELYRYALGKQPDSLCWWLEYNTIALGSIKGGNSKKFKIYYANKEDEWIYPKQFSNVEQAWNELRSNICSFVDKFKSEKYELLNDASLISSMNMFKTKLLYMYFPKKLLPVYSLDHIQKVLIYFGYTRDEVKYFDIVSANMKLKEFQDNSDEFKHWDGLKFMRFLYSSIFPKFNILESDENVVEDIEILDAIYKVNNYIKNQGYSYTYEQLSNLYLSLKTKPFVILAGISGTGKSKIARLLAKSLGATPKNNRFNMISVRPDWNDSTELIGYKNLKDQFVEGHLTKIIIDASKEENKNKPYFICLDEMNLARVEYYLSDYLSIIESRKKAGENITTDKLMENNIGLPDNIYIIGTVNMDDTTFQFSRKVLDRANTIEFSDVDLENLFAEITEENIEHLNVSNDLLRTTYLKTTDIEEDQREYAKEVNKKIIEINEILKKSQKQFAYRVRDEILFYMIENKKSNLLDEDVAFDYQIMQKILPAISGSESNVSDALIDLFNLVCDKKIISTVDIEEVKNYLEKENVRYKNSAEKIMHMLKGYQNDGYVSFWY